MVKILKYLSYALFFILSLMYFTPKVALYYFLESQINPYGVVVTDESVVDNGFTLNVDDAVVTFQGIPSADVKMINIAIFGIYNKISVKDVTLASSASSLVPTDVEYVNISYHIFNPLNISASASGGFGQLDAQVNLLDRNVTLKLEPSKLMSKKYRSTLKNLKKSKDGGYEYAKTF